MCDRLFTRHLRFLHVDIDFVEKAYFKDRSLKNDDGYMLQMFQEIITWHFAVTTKNEILVIAVRSS